jgi:hypothetical protein
MANKRNNRRRRNPVAAAPASAPATPAPPASFADTDTDSVDSKGNIRDLIDYDYTDDDASSQTMSEGSDSEFDFDMDTRDDTDLEDIPARPKRRRPQRKAALKAQELIAKITQAELKEPMVTAEGIPLYVRVPPAAKVRRSKAVVESDESESDGETLGSEDTRDEDEDEDEDADEEMAEDDDDTDDNDTEDGQIQIPTFSISVGAPEVDRMVPVRHNMKKETSEVKEFVKLLTAPIPENDIDSQIDFFKALAEDKRTQLLDALKTRPSATNSAMNLMFKILTMNLAPEVRSLVLAKYQSLQGLDPSTSEYFKLRNWLDRFCSIPLGIYKDIPVRIEDGQAKCGQFMVTAKGHLDNSMYGQEEAKLQIMQFIASKITNPDARGLSLLLIGPPGIGKTTLIKNGIAKALDWPFQFISLGGDSDASTYTGHQLVYESSHAGKIVNSIIAAKSMSMVLMFDELDKISQTPKGEEIGNLLIHLTDPVQNDDFEDKYFAGVPIHLGKTMFIFSGNDINKIDRILLDRMQVVHLAGYKAEDKVVIAERHLLPASLKEVNLVERVGIGREVIRYIIDKYAKSETGVRQLKRCIDTIVQKINMLRIYNDKALPFHLPDFSLPFIVKKEHIDLFLKRNEPPTDEPPMGMYI